MSEVLERVFVYGTLRRGASNHFRVGDGGFVGGGRVRGGLYRIDWYPGLVLDSEGDEVIGDVFDVSAGRLAELDLFEGLPQGFLVGQEYRRVRTMVDLLDGGRVEAWVWEWIGEVDPGRRVVSGDWVGG